MRVFIGRSRPPTETVHRLASRSALNVISLKLTITIFSLIKADYMVLTLLHWLLHVSKLETYPVLTIVDSSSYYLSWMYTFI